MFHFKVDVFEVERPKTNEAIVRTSDTERLIDTEAVQRYPRTYPINNKVSIIQNNANKTSHLIIRNLNTIGTMSISFCKEAHKLIAEGCQNY